MNLRDPNHDDMEWNHTLPQCIFKGHGPGQWLTMEQHAIASALQTLAFEHDVICGWHWKYLPEELRKKTKEVVSRVKSERITGINNHQYGKPHTQETKEKIARTLSNGAADGFNRKGKLHPMYGKSHNPESKRKISESMRGDKNHNYGKQMSQKQKDEISLTKKKRFKCLVTGFISSFSGLSKYQNSRRIDTSLRIQIN